MKLISLSLEELNDLFQDIEISKNNEDYVYFKHYRKDFDKQEPYNYPYNTIIYSPKVFKMANLKEIINFLIKSKQNEVVNMMSKEHQKFFDVVFSDVNNNILATIHLPANNKEEAISFATVQYENNRLDNKDYVCQKTVTYIQYNNEIIYTVDDYYMKTV